MRFHSIIILFLLTISCSPQKPTPFFPADYTFPQSESFTVMTWNLENFVDEFDSPYINNRSENSARMNPEKVFGFGEIIKRANADIITFQEVESRPLILALLDSVASDMGYRFSASSESPDWHQNVVIVSRFPLGAMSGFGAVHSPVYTDLDSLGNLKTQSLINTRIVSTPVFVRPDYAFHFVGVHLKAGRGERNKGMRKGQMELILDDLSRSPWGNHLIAGDFNTVPDSSDFEFLESHGFHDLFGGPKPFSHPADSAFWRLDHIMPNSVMKREFVPNSIKVFTPFSPDSMNAISDHLPVVATFSAKEM